MAAPEQLVPASSPAHTPIQSGQPFASSTSPFVCRDLAAASLRHRGARHCPRVAFFFPLSVSLASFTQRSALVRPASMTQRHTAALPPCCPNPKKGELERTRCALGAGRWAHARTMSVAAHSMRPLPPRAQCLPERNNPRFRFLMLWLRGAVGPTTPLSTRALWWAYWTPPSPNDR